MKVGIQNKAGWLILVWNDGKRRTMATGIRADIAGAKSLAQKTATRIESDFHRRDEGYYDPTLLKYKPRVLGKTASEISASELFDRFTKHQARIKGLSQSSIDARYKPIRTSLTKYLNKPANTIGKREAERFADVCTDTLQPSTAKARICLLVSCWEWAKGKYHVDEENPFKGLAVRFRSQDKKQTQPFSASEVQSILDGFRSSKYYASYADFVTFLFGVGVRIGEGVGLRWENVANDFTSVYICESITRGVVGSTKTKRSRTVNLSPSIAAMLKQRKESQQPNPTDLVFTTPTGLSINDRNFRRRAWTQVLKAVGVPYRKPYASRCTAISHALAAGVDYISVAKAAGHSPQILHENYANVIERRSVFVDFN
jgi:integrase